MVDLFHGISYEEEKAVITDEFKDISNKDLHIIDAIGIKKPKNMSTIARDLNITVGTLTTAISNLLKKGYVIRKRGERDRRVVYISLSEKGRKAYNHHREFHKQMIQRLLDTLNEQEQDLLVKVMHDMRRYLGSSRIPSFHPVTAYLEHLPHWDGHDRVSDETLGKR